jgi:hypothetical protein
MTEGELEDVDLSSERTKKGKRKKQYSVTSG